MTRGSRLLLFVVVRTYRSCVHVNNVTLHQIRN
jgi:hypothetical protein